VHHRHRAGHLPEGGVQQSPAHDKIRSEPWWRVFWTHPTCRGSQRLHRPDVDPWSRSLARELVAYQP
jgi:hypothetical protein